RAFNEPQGDWSFWSRLVCHLQELWRRVEADDLRRCAGIERQIEARTDTNLKDSPSRTRYNAVAIRREDTLPHGQMYEPRNDSFLIEGHCSLEKTSVRHSQRGKKGIECSGPLDSWAAHPLDRAGETAVSQANLERSTMA